VAAGVFAAGRIGVDLAASITDAPPEVDLSGVRLTVGVPAPRIITRAEWGADESLRSGTPSFAAIKRIIVHHTVTQNDDPDPAQRVRAIYRHHTVSNGWSDIGYNFLVDQHGRVFEGRWARNYAAGEVHSGEDTKGRGVIGAHAAGHNTGTVGIAILGTYSSVGPSTAAVESVIKLASWICDRHGINPHTPWSTTNDAGQAIVVPSLCGHRDVRSTACPGNGCYGHLERIRSDTAFTVSRGLIGYRVVASNGLISHLGGARDYGNVLGTGARTEVTGGAALRNSQGYWIVDRYGGVFSFGGAKFKGSIPGLRAQGVNVGVSKVMGITPTRTGNGYWLYDEAGGIFSFGDASFKGSVPWLRDRGVAVGPARIIDMKATPSGKGYWVLDAAGGVFTFGDAKFFGSVPWLRQRGHAVGPAGMASIAPTPSGRGYWVLDDQGGVFNFGDAKYFGSLPAAGVRDAPARRIVPATDGRGYLILTHSGSVYGFGRVPFYGRWNAPGVNAVDLLPVIRTS